MKKNSAFTLVELMVTMLIAGILVSIAVVSYNAYINKSRMAEATSIIDHLGKSEVTYYLTHKSFIGFAVPTDTNLVPSAGAKIRVDSASTAVPSGGWNELGKPLADGTMVSYKFGGTAAKNDSAGTVISSPMLTAWNQTMGGGQVQDPTGLNTCLSAIYCNDWLSYVNTPNKASVCIYGTANFINEANDYWGNSTSVQACSVIAKNITIDSDGKLITANPPKTYDFGH